MSVSQQHGKMQQARYSMIRARQLAEMEKKQLHEPVTAAFRVVPQVKITPDAANPADVVAVLHISQLHAPAVAQQPSPEGAGS